MPKLGSCFTALLLTGCLIPSIGRAQDTYSISNTQILKNGAPAVFAGVNAFGTNGPNASMMNGLSITLCANRSPTCRSSRSAAPK